MPRRWPRPIAGRIRRTILMNNLERFLAEHQDLTRRYFLRLNMVSTTALNLAPRVAHSDPPAPELAKALERLEPYFTPQEKFRDVSRGKPLPHALSEDKKRQVGLTPSAAA